MKTVWTEKDITDLENHLAKMGMHLESLRRVLLDDFSKEATYKAKRMNQKEIDNYLSGIELKRQRGEE